MKNCSPENMISGIAMTLLSAPWYRDVEKTAPVPKEKVGTAPLGCAIALLVAEDMKKKRMRRRCRDIRLLIMTFPLRGMPSWTSRRGKVGMRLWWDAV